MGHGPCQCLLPPIGDSAVAKRNYISISMSAAFAKVRESCVGTITQATKATTHQTWRIAKGEYIVAKEFTVEDVRKSTGTIKLMVTDKEERAKALQVELIKKTAITLPERQAAIAAARSSKQITVDVTELKKIHPKAAVDILRVGLPPLGMDDIATAQEGHWAVGRSFEVKDWLHGPGDILGGFSGKIEVTKYDHGAGYLTLRFPDGKSGTYMPIELVGFVEGFEEDSEQEHAPAQPANKLLIDLSGKVNMQVMAKGFPNSPADAGRAAVCDVLTLAKALPLPLTRVAVAAQNGGLSLAKKHALAVAYAEELEARCVLQCKLLKIPKLPNNKTIAAGVAWDTAIASWISAETNTERPYGVDYFSMPTFAHQKPRASAFHALAVDTQAFAKFLDRLGAGGTLDLTVQESAHAGSISLAASLERVLMGMGAKAAPGAIAPALITHNDLLDTNGLLERFYDTRGAGGGIEHSNTEGEQHHTPKHTRHVAIVQQPLDTSGSEHEQSARGVTLQAAIAIQECTTEVKELFRIGGLVDDHTAMKARIDAASPNIQRILLHAETPAAVLANRIDLDLLNTIGVVRSALGINFRKALLGDDVEEPSNKKSKGLELIRLGRVDKVKLLDLVDKEGMWTAEEPIRSFDTLPESRATFLKAFLVLQQAWILAKPNWASQILSFCQRLTSVVADCCDDGGNFTVLCPWYRSVMRAVCKPTVSYAGRLSSNQPGNPPTLNIISDLNSLWSIELRKSLAKIQSKLAADQAVKDLAGAMPGAAGDTLLAEVASLRKQLANTNRDKKPKRERSERKEKEAPAKTPKKDDAEKASAKKAADTKAKEAKGKGDWDGRSRVAQMEHLVSTVGDADGKKPCLFHHTAGKTCNKSADDCTFHHKD